MEEEEPKPMQDACIAFANYLNTSGGAESMSDALLDLFLLDKNRPENSVEFVRQQLNMELNKKFARLKKEVESSRAYLKQLNEVVEEMRIIDLEAEPSEMDSIASANVSQPDDVIESNEELQSNQEVPETNKTDDETDHNKNDHNNSEAKASEDANKTN